jgi:hypothetical protein
MPTFVVPSRPHLLNTPDLFLPRMIASLRANVNHPTLQAFQQALAQAPIPVPVASLATAYDQLSPLRKRTLYGAGADNAAALQPAEVNQFLATTIQRRATAIRIEHKQRLRRIGDAYTKLKALTPKELLEFRSVDWAQKIAAGMLLGQTLGTDECCPKETPQPPQNPPPQFGFKLNYLKCVEQEDITGDDRTYFVTVAVDGAMRVVANHSFNWKMDTGQARYPNWYIYPPNNPNNFLDIAAVLYEDDGGYAQVGALVTAIGDSVRGIGGVIGNPYVQIAGGIISIAGDFISLASGLDDDDELGVANFTYESLNDLETGVGALGRRFTGDDADYRATFQLLRA